MEQLRPFSLGDIRNSTNCKVQDVIEKITDDFFVERINTYSETYWDKAWSSWSAHTVLDKEQINK